MKSCTRTKKNVENNDLEKLRIVRCADEIL